MQISFVFSNLLVLEDKLDVLVGKSHQVGADQSHDSVQNCRLDQVHVPNPPEQPWTEEASHTVVINNS